MKLVDILKKIGVPYKLSGKDLLERYGTTNSPYYGLNVVPVSDVKPMIEGHVLPYEARYESEFLPAYVYRCYFDSDPDPRENLKITTARLSEILGEGVSVENGCMTHIWRYQDGLIKLEMLFPRPQKPGRDPLQDAHSHMLHYGWMHIIPDNRKPMNAQESEWISAGVRPFSHDKDGRFVKTNLADKSYGSVLPGISRYIDAGDFPNMCGVTTDSQALIAGDGHDVLIVPKNQVVGVRLRRTTSSRGGGGGSHLGILYTDPGLPELAVMSASLYFGETAGRLNNLAKEIADWAEVSVSVIRDSDY